VRAARRGALHPRCRPRRDPSSRHDCCSCEHRLVENLIGHGYSTRGPQANIRCASVENSTNEHTRWRACKKLHRLKTPSKAAALSHATCTKSDIAMAVTSARAGAPARTPRHVGIVTARVRRNAALAWPATAEPSPMAKAPVVRLEPVPPRPPPGRRPTSTLPSASASSTAATHAVSFDALPTLDPDFELAPCGSPPPAVLSSVQGPEGRHAAGPAESLTRPTSMRVKARRLATQARCRFIRPSHLTRQAMNSIWVVSMKDVDWLLHGVSRSRRSSRTSAGSLLSPAIRRCATTRRRSRSIVPGPRVAVRTLGSRIHWARA